MWPYDYFNQFSSLEIDIVEGEKINARTPVFVAMWYGKKKDSTKKQQDKIYARIKKVIEKRRGKRASNIIIHSRDSKGQINRVLYYRLKAMKAEHIKKGSIDINILGKIIESTLVICDISSICRDRYRVNPNVMFELGIATAWKMPEQVVILCRNHKKEIEGEIPSDIKKYHIDFVDDKYQDLEKIIIRQLKSFKNRKDVLIRSIKSKLDKDSLRALARRNGLMFVEQDLDSYTIRHLLDLGIIRTEIFPSSPITFGYCLTTIGKKVLWELKKAKTEPEIGLYPDRLIDMYRVRFWHGYPKYFRKKKKEFYYAYGVKWDDCLRTFIKYIPLLCKKSLIRTYNLKLKTYKDKLNIFNKYLRDYPFDFVSKNTVEKWENTGNK